METDFTPISEVNTLLPLEDPQSLRSCEELVEALRAEISRASEDDGKGRRCLVSADLLTEVAEALELYGVNGGALEPWCADCHKFGANCTCGVECPNCQEWKDDCTCGFDPDEDEDDDWEDDDEDDWDEEEDEDEA